MILLINNFFFCVCSFMINLSLVWLYVRYIWDTIYRLKSNVFLVPRVLKFHYVSIAPFIFFLLLYFGIQPQHACSFERKQYFIQKKKLRWTHLAFHFYILIVRSYVSIFRHRFLWNIILWAQNGMIMSTSVVV